MVTPKIGDTASTPAPADRAERVAAAIGIRKGMITRSAMTTSAASNATVLKEGNKFFVDVVDTTDSISVGILMDL
jgi:hypothetical protein